MEFTVFRDLASIAFIRCIAPIPGTGIYAEGVGFSVLSSVARCRSELIESQFQLKHAAKNDIAGIAAHPIADESDENAFNESLESLFLQAIAKNPQFWGWSVSLLGIRFSLARVNDRFISLAIFRHEGMLTATQAVSRNPLRAMLRAWTEVRNIRIYQPRSDGLSAYTKANKYLTAKTLADIKTIPSFSKNEVSVKNLVRFQHKEKSHYVTYYQQESRK